MRFTIPTMGAWLPFLVFTFLGALPLDEEAIRRVRAASNEAIAQRDLSALLETWVPDLHVTASNGQVFTSGEAMAQAFEAAFMDSTFVTYVRTPIEIQVSGTGPFAAESGNWVGQWQRPDGEMHLRGVYLAQWRKAEGQWRIRSELFVALSCSGSMACPQRP